jgi:hypothetical protein
MFHLRDEREDVFVSVAPYDGSRHRGAGAISRCGLLHRECDRPDGQERVAAFPLRPQLLIASDGPGQVEAHSLANLPKPSTGNPNN